MTNTFVTVGLIVGIVLLVAGVPLGIVVVAFRGFKKQERLAREAALAWPSTTGRVVQSRVETIDGSTSVAKVWYAFSVAGKSYENDKIWVVPPRPVEPPRATVDRYPVGMNVLVYYDPADPHTSVLERG